MTSRLLTTLKEEMLRTACRVVRWTRPARPTDGSLRHAMIVVPFALGSIGDEAMVGGLSAALAARGCQRITLVTYRHNETWPGIAVPTDYLPLPGYFAYGARGDQFRLLRASRHVDRFFLLGADVLDGYYNEEVSLRMIQLAALADALGLPATIVGFSLNATPRPSVLAALRAMPARVRLCCRDPETLARLQTAESRAFQLTADVAFLLEPRQTRPETGDVLAWLESQQAEGKMVLGVNLNQAPAEAIGCDVPHWIATALAAELACLQQRVPQLSLLLIPHDQRDPALAEPFLAALPETLRARTRVLPLLPATDIKAIVGRLDAVVSGRMHLAIACLGQGTPAITLEYQGKTLGLHRHFGTEALNTSAEELRTPGQMACRLEHLLAHRDDYRAQMVQRFPEIRRLAGANLDLS